MHKSINLVGVKASVYAAGVEIDGNEAGYWQGYPAVVNGKPGEDPESYVTDSRPGWCRATTEIVVFEFTCIGFGYGDCRGALDFEVGNVGWGEVFGNDLVDLSDQAKTLLGQQPIRHGYATERTVNFVVAYSYSSGQDQFSGEWDTEWEQIGQVNLYPNQRGPVTSLAILPEPTSPPSAG